MRKSIFTALAAGAVVLAGCARIETTEVPEGRVISFDKHVDNVVKAIDEPDDLTAFRVFGAAYQSGGSPEGFMVFDNDLVEVDGSGEWNSSETKYWQEGYSYRFAAYSNDNKGLDEGTDFKYENGLSITYSQPASGSEIREKMDLLYGISNKTYDGSTYVEGNTTEEVQLTFYHILSKLRFVFTKDATLNGHDITVKDITFNACSTGTFAPTDGEWEVYPKDNGQLGSGYWTVGEEMRNDYTLTLSNNGVITGSTNAAVDGDGIENGVNNILPVKDSVFMIPQANNNEVPEKDLKINFTIEWDADGMYENDPSGTPEIKTKKFTVDLKTLNGQWYPGFMYIYTATISAENLDLVPIEFDVTEVVGWEDPAENVDNEIIAQ